EQIGISNAASLGRGGRAVVMVRSGGNFRTRGDNADDDGYLSDSRVIAVAAARVDGGAASYSEPGACVLVAAPSGDTGFPTLFTTDLLGTDGVNQINFGDTNLSNYAFDAFGFSGTSASAPLVSGVVALMLSVNPNLTARDVQQILILASRHFDLADPDVVTNGAGFRVSHNVGFGVPDAGQAVALAQRWVNRPPLTTVTYATNSVRSIPDSALRVLITGTNLPANLASIPPFAPSIGPHADSQRVYQSERRRSAAKFFANKQRGAGPNPPRFGHRYLQCHQHADLRTRRCARANRPLAPGRFTHHRPFAIWHPQRVAAGQF